MENHIATYADEQGHADDPEKLNRFVTFVNAPGVPTRRSSSPASAARSSR